MTKATAIAALLVLLVTGGVHSSGMPPVANSAESATTGVAVGEFVGPDGRIDLDAMRRSGYEGALNLEGFDMTIDPATGQPSLRPPVDAETDSDPNDIYWSPLGSGTNATIYALIVHDGKLIAGGYFTAAGGVTANRIASWDGSSWSPLGLGTNGPIYALTVYDGKLIAGGDFHTAGGVAASHIASWDGSNWSPLGSGMDSSVRALTVYDGKLIAGGTFTAAGGATANRIASWDGSSWSPLGLSVDEVVFALTVYDGKLIAAAVYRDPYWEYQVGLIASWDGSTWSSLWSGDFCFVLGLAVYDESLVAIHTRMPAPGYVRAWDGNAWTTLGTAPGMLFALTECEGKLIVGGTFGDIGGVAANNIASWNGSSWSPLGSGVNSGVCALTSYSHELIAGGNFTTAGDKDAAYIAAWTKGKQCCETPGDANDDGVVNMADLHYLHDYLHNDVAELPCFVQADVNGDGEITTEDLSCLARYLYSTGNPCVFVPCP